MLVPVQQRGNEFGLKNRLLKFLGVTSKKKKQRAYPGVCNRKFLSVSKSSFSLGEGEHQTCAIQSAKDNISSGINTENSLQLKLYFLLV